MDTADQRVRAAGLARRDAEVDLFLTLQRVADRLMQGLEEALRPTGITPVQYLVLRSLRQARAAGMPSKQIVRSLTTHDPDITRLLDKLEERGVVQRWRPTDDRRVVRVRLTRDGARLLRQLTLLTRGLHRKQFRPITARETQTLHRLLDELNETPIPRLPIPRGGREDRE